MVVIYIVCTGGRGVLQIVQYVFCLVEHEGFEVSVQRKLRFSCYDFPVCNSVEGAAYVCVMID